MNLQKIVHEKNEIMARLFQERLDNELFPMDFVSNQWRYCAQEALMKTPPIVHRLSLSDYAKAVEADFESGRVTLFQFGVLSNSIESVSPDQLRMKPPEYLEFIREVKTHIATYSKIVTKIRQDVELEAEAEYKAKAAVNGTLKVAGDA